MFTHMVEEADGSMSVAIYGSQSIALGVYQAVKELYPDYSICCFLVTSLQNNPSVLAGLPVKELEGFSKEISRDEKDMIRVLIATPEDIHLEIVDALKQHGFYHYICIDSQRETKLMEQYFLKKQIFPSIHTLKPGTEAVHLQVFMAKFYKDRKLQNKYEVPEWLCPLQAGAGLTKQRVAEYMDNIGDNISCKNANYCELTALYWIWKNRLDSDYEYFGLFHYRRILDITGEDLFRFHENDIDAILPYPTIHEPDISEHHARYVKEEDWQAMLQALVELQPEYARAVKEVFKQTYFYNYNIVIAKKNVLSDYCTWLFPILKRTEELSIPRGEERADRYIGYLGENLMTLYFLYNQKKLKIYHTGRFMFT